MTLFLKCIAFLTKTIDVSFFSSASVLSVSVFLYPVTTVTLIIRYYIITGRTEDFLFVLESNFFRLLLSKIIGSISSLFPVIFLFVFEKVFPSFRFNLLIDGSYIQSMFRHIIIMDLNYI